MILDLSKPSRIPLPKSSGRNAYSTIAAGIHLLHRRDPPLDPSTLRGRNCFFARTTDVTNVVRKILPVKEIQLTTHSSSSNFAHDCESLHRASQLPEKESPLLDSAMPA